MANRKIIEWWAKRENCCFAMTDGSGAFLMAVHNDAKVSEQSIAPVEVRSRTGHWTGGA
jgi:hypothetical protein